MEAIQKAVQTSQTGAAHRGNGATSPPAVKTPQSPVLTAARETAPPKATT
jgi:hypothetical protein